MKKFLIAFLLAVVVFTGAFAKNYKLKNGTTVTGKIVSTNGNNVVIEDERGNAQVVSKDLFVEEKTPEAADTNQGNMRGSVDSGNMPGTSYKGFAVGLSTTDLILGPLLSRGEMFIFYTMTEFALWKHIGLQVDIGLFLGSASTGGLQFGGGLRWYFSGQGIQKFWLGAYFDAYGTSWDQGYEFGVLAGYKFVFGAFFVDPFAGGRILSSRYDGVYPTIRYGCNIGLVF